MMYIISQLHIGNQSRFLIFSQLPAHLGQEWLDTALSIVQSRQQHRMIVPEFKLKQDDRFVSVFIRVPYIKVTACEFYIEANTFKFYLKPYLLSLSFEQRLREAEEPAKATYYHQKYVLEVHLEKQTPGEFFNNLDLISSVVNRKKEKKSNRVSIEVIGGTQTKAGEGEQQSKLRFSEFNYGFCQQYSNVFNSLEEQVVELFAFNPKDTPLSSRYSLSRDIIASEFDVESYLFDKYQNQDQISSVLQDRSFAEYIEQLHKRENGPEISSEEYRLKMKMGKKELLISKQSQAVVRKEIISILFSYLYQLICMGGEMGPESARTINQTSLVLACNATYGDMALPHILIDCFRRCMAYSLYKSLKLCAYVQQMLGKYLRRSYVKVILEDLRRLFQQNQPRYLLNKIYIDDYLFYVYSMQQEQFEQFRQELYSSQIGQNDLGLAITQYEQDGDEAADTAISEEKEASHQAKLIEEIQSLNMLD